MNTLSLYSDAGIALVRLNRPATRNAIDDTLIAELTHTVATLNQDPELRVVILSGEGEAFCAGMDLGYLARLAQFGEEENRADSRALLELLLAIRESPLPWIAAVNGPAIAGGCGLATACDLILADREKARFGYTETRIGFIPAIVSPLLVERVGMTRARDLLLSGRIVSAGTALELGLINELADPGAVLALAGSRAQALARQCSRDSLAATKSLLRRISGLELRSAMELALEDNVRLRQSASCKRGVEAFLAKQELDWRLLDRDPSSPIS